MITRVGTVCTAVLLLGACGGAATDEVAVDAVVEAATSPTDPSPTDPDAATPVAPTSTQPAIATSPATEPMDRPDDSVAVADVGLGAATFDLAGCPDAARGAVADKANQRYWLCMDGVAVTDEIPMTTASSGYGLPPVGTYEVFARDENAFGINGEPLERFVAFYTTSKGNRIAFHEVVDQDPATVGDLAQRGASAGCFRVREADSIQVWDFLQIGDPVVILTN